MTQQRKNKGSAADVARKRGQCKWPEEIGPVKRAVKHQIEDFYSTHHDMGGVGQRNQPRH